MVSNMTLLVQFLRGLHRSFRIKPQSHAGRLQHEGCIERRWRTTARFALVKSFDGNCLNFGYGSRERLVHEVRAVFRYKIWPGQPFSRPFVFRDTKIKHRTKMACWAKCFDLPFAFYDQKHSRTLHPACRQFLSG